VTVTFLAAAVQRNGGSIAGNTYDCTSNNYWWCVKLHTAVRQLKSLKNPCSNNLIFLDSGLTTIKPREQSKDFLNTAVPMMVLLNLN